MNSIQPDCSFVSQPSTDQPRIDFDSNETSSDRDGSLPAFRPVVHRFAVHNVTRHIRSYDRSLSRSSREKSGRAGENSESIERYSVVFNHNNNNYNKNSKVFFFFFFGVREITKLS